MKKILAITLTINLLFIGAIFALGQSRDKIQEDFFDHYFDQNRLSEVPKDGFVTKPETALAIAKAVLNEQPWVLNSSKGPWKVKMLKGIWIVYNDPKGKDKDKSRMAVIEIEPRTGSIIRFIQFVD